MNAPARSEATAGGAQLRYSFPATPENVEQFIADIHEFLAERNLGGLAFDMELLAREALVNAVQHGSASDPTKTVHASLSLAQGRLELVVRDEGHGWDWRAMVVSHKLCQDCHKASKKGPVNCSGCHKSDAKADQSAKPGSLLPADGLFPAGGLLPAMPIRNSSLSTYATSAKSTLFNFSEYSR